MDDRRTPTLMPVYEYACTECGAVEDHLMSIGTAWLDPCAACGGVLRRRFSRVAVRYRGWGFTSTDRLVSDRHAPRKDFDALSERAERISDE